MVDYARRMLDNLMGHDRNQDLSAKRTVNDPMVCRWYLVDFCPHDLFINTKSDMGLCPLFHDERLKNEYQSLSESERDDLGFASLFFFHLKGLIRDLDRRISRARERIELKGSEDIERASIATKTERAEKIVLLEEKIKQIQKKIEICGEEGLIDEAMDLDREMEGLNVQLQTLKSEESRERKNEVCEICGAILVENDSEERIQAHMTGKQHLGYKKIRDTYASLQKKFDRGFNRRERYSDDRGSFHSSRESSISRGSHDRRGSRESYRQSDDRRYDRSYRGRDYRRRDYERRRSRSPGGYRRR